MNTPLISVLMTAFNREQYIASAISSVLQSTYKNFELIVVDDCSTDQTISIAMDMAQKDNRILVFKNKVNLGDYKNRNKAASYARGHYIKYLDSDDILYPHGLQVMIDGMLKFPDAAFGLSSITSKSSPLPVCLTPREIYLEHFNGFGHFNRAPGSSIIKRSVFETLGGFADLRLVGDFEFWFRIAKKHNMVKFPRDLVWDRIHAGQESRSEYAKLYDKLRSDILDKALYDPDCPLNKLEVDEIKKNVSRRKKKQQIKNIVKSFWH